MCGWKTIRCRTWWPSRIRPTYWNGMRFSEPPFTAYSTEPPFTLSGAPCPFIAKAVNLTAGVHGSSAVFLDTVNSTRTRFMNIPLGPPHPFLTYFLLSLNFSLQRMLLILAVRYSCVHNVSYVHITRNVLLCVANNINNNYWQVYSYP